jgi:hypothetical protein
MQAHFFFLMYFIPVNILIYESLKSLGYFSRRKMFWSLTCVR